MKKWIIARKRHEGKMYKGKREVELYDEDTELSPAVIADANKGLILRVQRQIRDSLAVRHGFKQVSAGDTTETLDDIEEA